jgi:Flp pilus assembly protein TadB
MVNEEPKNNLNTQTGGVSQLEEESEQEETRKGNWREVFRTAFERARRQQKPAAGRQELGRDKSKAFVLLAGTGVALLLLFFSVFSSPKKRTPLPEKHRMAKLASDEGSLLGRKTQI